jgi:hypothetical protein
MVRGWFLCGLLQHASDEARHSGIESPVTELAMSQTSMAQIPLPPDVLAYAAEKGVAQFLLPHLELTKRIFPAARRLEVVLEEDPEIADLTFIVFKV